MKKKYIYTYIIMNNSFKKKMNENQQNNHLSNLSSTSSEFITNKKNNIKQKGGKCNCEDIIKAILIENLELILYILKKDNCCYCCQDSNGNTVIHLLIQLCNTNIDIKNELINLFSNKDCLNFINIQNNNGQTPILLAVMNDQNDLAEIMENAGADVSIEDNNGNFVGIKEDIENNNNNNQIESDINNLPIQNIYNVFNIILKKDKERNDDLTSLNINNLSEPKSNNLMEENTDNFMKLIKSKIENSLLTNNNNSESSLTSSSEYLELPEIDSEKSETINTDKFITLLDNNNNPLYYNYSDIEDTDQFISILKDKYSSQTKDDKKPEKFKEIKINNKNINNSITSDIESSINTQMIKLENETTSDENKMSAENLVNNIKSLNSKKINNNTIFNKTINTNKKKNNQITSDIDTNKKNDQITSDIDTNVLLNAIKKIQSKYDNNLSNDNIMKGGVNMKNNKQKVMGYRNLNGDSDLFFLNNNSDNIDYNILYNSESELGKKKNKSKSNTNELKRMMISQKEKLHEEVLEMIMGMLNKGLLIQSNKPIEASEKNAKLCKAYIYRKISETNPQMGGIDKIMTFKAMDQKKIINMIKEMPDLDELEKSIKKHLENKQKIKKLEKSEESEKSEKSEKSKKSKKSEKSEKSEESEKSEKSNKKEKKEKKVKK